MMNFLSFFLTLRWQDVADVVLNSYILFRLYALFRGTHVFRVAIAIAILWFFQRIAASLDLIVTSWVAQGVAAVGALIIVVVFRNEIRSVLQVKNLRLLLWGTPLQRVDAPIDTLVESVFQLAKSYVGGLLVFAGREDLKDIVHSGIPWKGLISKEMIWSVFWPDGPVHDGAVIIEGDKIGEVGCVLPLSRRTDLPAHYGTRHRAAAGLAESTDALIIVISEERGEVTVAKGQVMEPIAAKEDLAFRLRQHLGLAEKEGPGIRRRMEMGLAASVCFFLVAGLWFSVARGLDTLVRLEVPIEYVNRAPNTEIVDASVNAVRLHLSGSGAIMKFIRPDQVKVRLNLEKATIGENLYTITKDDIVLPPGVLLKEVRPESVEVTVDVPVRKDLPVQVDWTGRLPDHLILTEVKVEPETIQIIGGSTILAKMSTLYTEKVSLDKNDKSGTLTAKPALHPASLKVAPESKDRIKVSFVVKERK